MSGSWTSYDIAGFDPDDGLINGRWMRDTWGVVRWVQIGPEAPAAPKPRSEGAGYCAMCGVGIYKGSRHCRRCVKKASVLAKEAAA